jgi:glycosyltransferase involved in cell wall biosynthesis
MLPTDPTVPASTPGLGSEVGAPGVIRHVLMTVDAVGGVWTYALDLSRGLGERGVRVSLVLMGPPPSDAQREDAAAIATVDMYERPYALEWMDDPWCEVAEAGEWLLELERELRPDIVHLNGYCHASLRFNAPVLVTGHSCVLSWWRAVYGTDAPAKWDVYADKVSEGLQTADLVVAPTAAMLSNLDFHYGPLLRRRVISNGRYAAGLFATPPSSKDAVVLTAGRVWDQAKNVEAVAAVAPYLSWPVYIAGESRRPSGDAVTYDGMRGLGRLSARELAAWMGRAAIYALPARYEPFGLSVLEAGLAGCALVLGDIRSLREIWGDAALYVPPDNRRALVAAIEGLIRDAEYRQELATRAQSRARELTPRRMADGYYGAYRDLIRARLRLTA